MELVIKGLYDFLRKSFAFLKRDFWIMLSYRFAFLLQLFGIFFQLAMFFFISRLFGGAITPYLQRYGVDFFSYVLMGVAFMGYLGVAMSSFSASIRQGQVTGTLELMLVTPTRLSVILLASSFGNFAVTSLRIVLYLIVGTVVFGVDLSNVNLLSAAVVQILTITTFGSIGIISASFVMVFKKGDPVTALVGRLSPLLGGVFVPPEVFPLWLKAISYMLPLTHSLIAMRLAVYQGYTIFQLAPQILVLLGFTVVLLPVSIFAFHLAVRKAKKEGSLIQY